MSIGIKDTYAVNKVNLKITHGELKEALASADYQAEDHRQQAEAWSNWAANIALRIEQLNKK
jgi:hypothetical protein